MGVSAKLNCMALFVAVFFAFVSSQSPTNSSSTDTSSTAPPEKGDLQCYSCSSYPGEPDLCSNPTAETNVETCLKGETMCRKVEQHITYGGDDHVRTFRECAKTGDLGECSERTGTHGFKSWYCQCKGNKCNSASSSFVSFTLLASMVAGVFYMKNRI
ncbi:hypothetical protein ElyMa_001842700 [Elysia marginata]|uniref:Protein sleepless n=1 Tax=Elysia marginata TaxID=1093978 RepID=A0AAV4EJM8_9GAST|nr:hypothetical protein ElyMa_001842700 [Elysia marginata]